MSRIDTFPLPSEARKRIFPSFSDGTMHKTSVLRRFDRHSTEAAATSVTPDAFASELVI
jgi:hypothetical protein